MPRPTPPLAPWIKEARVSGYVTAHQLCPDESWLYGTESLFGDWDAEVLLLAKDWGPCRFLRERIAAGVPARPYCHDPAMRTNRRLVRFTKPIEQIGLLYGSALANLLRDDDRVSGSLPNRPEAMKHGAAVLRWVLEHMPNLRAIMCLGLEAWQCGCEALNLVGDWHTHLRSSRGLGPLFAGFHPSARVSRDAMQGPWNLLAAQLNLHPV